MSEIFHPDTEIISTTEVVYDPTWVVQPPTVITTLSEVDYVPPPSTGGHPNIIITSQTVVEYEPVSTFVDIVGEAFIFIEGEGRLSVTVEPVPIPTDLEDAVTDVDIISVTMPVPTEFDQFGRPIG